MEHSPLTDERDGAARSPSSWRPAALAAALLMASLGVSTHSEQFRWHWGADDAAAAAAATAAALAATATDEAASTATVTATEEPAAATSAASSSLSSSSPHIVFVLVDDLGHNDVGYNSEDLPALTPTIDALAAGGVTLTAYYSMHMCTPARAALYTGRLPARTGTQYENIKPDSPWALPLGDAISLLPELLRDSPAGYRAQLVGKWNMGHYSASYLPTARGFDEFFGYLSDEINYFTHEYPAGFSVDADGPPTAFKDFMHARASASGSGASHYNFSRGADDAAAASTALDTFSPLLYTARVEAAVAAHGAGGAHDGTPLFLMYAAQNVHGPLDTPPRTALADAEWALLDGLASERRRTFGALVATLDHSVGGLVGAMERAGLWNNTLLFFASDNGGCHQEGGSNLPLRGGKHWLFEGGVRVPSFVHDGSGAAYAYLPQSARGATLSSLAHVTDWLPTLLDAAGVDAAADVAAATVAGWDGVSQWGALQRAGDADALSASAPRDEVLISLSSYTTCCDAADGSGTTCSGFLSDCAGNGYTSTLARAPLPRGALRVGGMKLILNEYEMPWYVPDEDADTGGATTARGASGNSMMNCGDNPGSAPRPFLFNLTADPFERVNLVDSPDPAVAAVLANLTARLLQYQAREVEPLWRAETSDPYAAWVANGGFIAPWRTGESYDDDGAR